MEKKGDTLAGTERGKGLERSDGAKHGKRML